MTREEQIKQFAKIRYKDIAGETDYIDTAAFEGVIEGAKWADEHPKEELHKEHVKNILKILNDYYHIGDGGPIWLETEKDYENVANNIIELEKL